MLRSSRQLLGSIGAAAACLYVTTAAGCSSDGDADTQKAGVGATTGGTASSSGGAGGGSGLTGSGLVTSGGTTSNTGGTTTTGGKTSVPTGGVSATGGGLATGGTPSTGGTTPTGGVSSKGGSPATGGDSSTGGKNSGGLPGTGGGGNGGASAGASGSGGGGGGMPSNCPAVTPQTGGKQYCSNTTGDINGGYSFELWAEGNGTGCMTVFNKAGTFKANWNNVEDLLARVGLNFDRNRKHAQIGTLTAEFNETKTGSDGLVYIGIYGWTVEPLKEYYILDDWGAIKPAGTASDGSPRTPMGTFTVDGEVYDVYKKLRENKPSIIGDATFEQYFSIRRTARQCGKISISEHFKQWEEFGMELGNLTEAKLLVEAQDSTGAIEFSTATVEVD
jgi:hypothetical protein